MEGVDFPLDLIGCQLEFLIVGVDVAEMSGGKAMFPFIDHRLCRGGFNALAAMSQTCRRYHAAVNWSGLWNLSAKIIHWYCGHCRHCSDTWGSRKRSSHMQLLRRLGSTSCYLELVCIGSLPCDLVLLKKSCPSIRALKLCFYGPEGMEGIRWISAWQPTLTCLEIHFWYDDCLGSPPIIQAMSHIRQCQKLELLSLRGVDWPRARMQICDAFKHCRYQSLHRLILEGSEPWSEPELDSIRSCGILVHCKRMPDRSR